MYIMLGVMFLLGILVGYMLGVSMAGNVGNETDVNDIYDETPISDNISNIEKGGASVPIKQQLDSCSLLIVQLIDI